MKICVDTVILIDVLKDEYPETQDKFYAAIQQKEKIIISTITAAELLPQFHGNKRLLQSFLKDHGIELVGVDLQTSLVGAERWMKYLKRKKMKRCPSCRAILPGREKILPDFLIGGCALVHSEKILTRDRGFYRTYFPDLKLL